MPEPSRLLSPGANQVLPALYPPIAKSRTQRKLIELTMLTAIARKNLGLYFCLRRREGCHFTGNINLDLTGKSAPDRLLLFLGENRGKAAS